MPNVDWMGSESMATKEAEILSKMPLDEIEAVIDVLQKTSDSCFYIMDMDDDLFITSAYLTHRFMLNGTRLEHAAANLKDIVYPADWDAVRQDLIRCRTGEQSSHDMEYRWVSREGKIVWINCRGEVVMGANGHKLLIGRVREIGQRSKADNLTGLLKEPRFREDVDEILRERPESIRYCMRIGIDNFKEINEKDGVDAGDAVLQQLADCIRQTVGESVGIYRLVADEFMIIDACDEPTRQPRDIFQEIRLRVAHAVKHQNYSRFYTVSGGVLQMDFTGKNNEDIMRLSEFALNEAKRHGKNQMADFNQDDYDVYMKQLDMRKAMRVDISKKFRGFQVYFQPIVDADTYQVVGAEALLRWQNEKYGQVSPGQFIPILEESGLIIPVGRHVLWEAAKMCKKWQKVIPTFHVNVNLSYVQIHRSDLMSDVERCIHDVGLEAGSLVLELTESGYIETDERIRALFDELKQRRVDLAIDDFGTGYSNMRYLREIKAKVVKIDRTFVLEAMNNEYDFVIIGHLIDMLHSVGSSVCMEGIEKQTELDKMKQTKPDLIQGFYFGKPMPADEFEEKYIVPRMAS